ncbi:ppsC, partial [Symbiodinium sp. CCMP2456]
MAEALQQVLAQATSEACVFVFSGEGAHGADTDISMLKLSPSWPAVQQALRDVGQDDPEAFLQENLGEHTAPNSPLVTVSLNILHADLWRHWGQEPSLVLGHSVGEIERDLLSVTLCGTSAKDYLSSDPSSIQLRPCHPWHHPEAPVPATLPTGAAARIPFISSVSATQLTELPKDHWQRWQRSPVRFADALCLARDLTKSKGSGGVRVLEMGAHPVLAAAIKATFSELRYACSMRRGERAASFLRQQRAGLGVGFRRQLQQVLQGFIFGGRQLCHTTSFAAQGIASQQLVMLAEALRPFFPGLAAHDLYRFSNIDGLLDWGADEMSESFSPPKTVKVQELHFEILACALRFPGAVDTPGAFWSMLLKDDQDAAFAAAPKEGPKAAFLQYKFDHRTALTAAGAAGVEGAEAAAMDPQHSFALHLAAEMWHDSAEAAEAAKAEPERVGVYLGAWQPVVSDTRASAYANLRRAGMLSASGRCHTFSALADGYVRGEGGALFLLGSAGSGHGPTASRAQLLGSAVNQNSTQKPLSSVDPLAQERVIRMACASASITTAGLTAVELHGTGTPLGDPVEVSALARLGCAATMTASKMHLGHLESAAGAVGLLKAVLLCENCCVPSFKIHGGLNPQVRAAMEGSCLKNPGDEVELPAGAFLGVSSFGFAGSNAHVVLAPTPTARACPKYEADAWEPPVPLRQYEQSIVETLAIVKSLEDGSSKAKVEILAAPLPRKRE